MELVSPERHGGVHPSPGQSLKRAACSLALGVGAFLVVSIALRTGLPPLPESALATKLAAVRPGDIDLLFVGSSSVYRHVDPALFDTLTSEAGEPTHSYNFGVPAMETLESLYALRSLLSQDALRENLEWVVLDARQAGYSLAGNNHLTARVAQWHDLQTTWLAVRLVFESSEPWEWKLEQVWRHGFAALLRLGNVGRLQELLSSTLSGNAHSRAGVTQERASVRRMERGRNDDGFAPLDWAAGQADPLQQRFLYERQLSWEAESERLLAQLDRAPEGRPRRLLTQAGTARKDQRLTQAEQDLLHDIVNELQSRGIQVLFMNSPDVRQREFFARAGLDAGLIPELLDTDRPDLYPALFRNSTRFDRDHLNEQGAEVYTRVLAQEFLKAVKRARREAGGDAR